MPALQKIGPKIHGVLPIIRIINPLMIELKLPKSLKRIHPVFHCSLLKPISSLPLTWKLHPLRLWTRGSSILRLRKFWILDYIKGSYNTSSCFLISFPLSGWMLVMSAHRFHLKYPHKPKWAWKMYLYINPFCISFLEGWHVMANILLASLLILPSWHFCNWRREGNGMQENGGYVVRSQAVLAQRVRPANPTLHHLKECENEAGMHRKSITQTTWNFSIGQGMIMGVWGITGGKES